MEEVVSPRQSRRPSTSVPQDHLADRRKATGRRSAPTPPRRQPAKRGSPRVLLPSPRPPLQLTMPWPLLRQIPLGPRDPLALRGPQRPRPRPMNATSFWTSTATWSWALPRTENWRTLEDATSWRAFVAGVRSRADYLCIFDRVSAIYCSLSSRSCASLRPVLFSLLSA